MPKTGQSEDIYTISLVVKDVDSPFEPSVFRGETLMNIIETAQDPHGIDFDYKIDDTYTKEGFIKLDFTCVVNISQDLYNIVEEISTDYLNLIEKRHDKNVKNEYIRALPSPIIETEENYKARWSTHTEEEQLAEQERQYIQQTEYDEQALKDNNLALDLRDISYSLMSPKELRETNPRIAKLTERRKHIEKDISFLDPKNPYELNYINYLQKLADTRLLSDKTPIIVENVIRKIVDRKLSKITNDLHDADQRELDALTLAAHDNNIIGRTDEEVEAEEHYRSLREEWIRQIRENEERKKLERESAKTLAEAELERLTLEWEKHNKTAQEEAELLREENEEAMILEAKRKQKKFNIAVKRQYAADGAAIEARKSAQRAKAERDKVKLAQEEEERQSTRVELLKILSKLPTSTLHSEIQKAIVMATISKHEDAKREGTTHLRVDLNEVEYEEIKYAVTKRWQAEIERAALEKAIQESKERAREEQAREELQIADQESAEYEKAKREEGYTSQKTASTTDFSPVVVDMENKSQRSSNAQTDLALAGRKPVYPSLPSSFIESPAVFSTVEDSKLPIPENFPNDLKVALNAAAIKEDDSLIKQTTTLREIDLNRIPQPQKCPPDLAGYSRKIPTKESLSRPAPDTSEKSPDREQGPSKVRAVRSRRLPSRYR